MECGSHRDKVTIASVIDLRLHRVRAAILGESEGTLGGGGGSGVGHQWGVADAGALGVAPEKSKCHQKAVAVRIWGLKIEFESYILAM